MTDKEFWTKLIPLVVEYIEESENQGESLSVEDFGLFLQHIKETNESNMTLEDKLDFMVHCTKHDTTCMTVSDPRQAVRSNDQLAGYYCPVDEVASQQPIGMVPYVSCREYWQIEVTSN